MTLSSTSFPPAPGARILSLGAYQPGNVVTNDDISARVDTSDEWIRSRVGIVERRIARSESVADLAVQSAAKALASSGRPARGCDRCRSRAPSTPGTWPRPWPRSATRPPQSASPIRR